MYSTRLVIPTAAVTAMAVVLASLFSFFAFGAKEAEAAANTIKVSPTTLTLGDVALDQTDTHTVKITNERNVNVELGEVDVQLLNGSADVEILKLVDSSGTEFLLNPITGLFKDILGNPLTILAGQQEIFELAFTPTEEGPIDFKVLFEFLQAGTPTVIKEVPVAVQGESRRCDIQGTENNDTLTDPTSGDDVVCGLGGNDTITSSVGGKDIFIGGAGNDTLTVKDGKRGDVASGGSGKHTCKKDKKDKKINCGKKGRSG